MSLNQALAIFFISGFASLDRLAGINVMLSRPIVVSGLIGLTFDTVVLSLVMGAIFEFIGMLEVPVGTTIAKDDTFGGYAASISLSLGVTSHNSVSVFICLVLVTIMIYPVTLTDKFCRYLNNLLIRKVHKNYNIQSENILIRLGVFVAFFRGVIAYNLAIIPILVIMYNIDATHQTSYDLKLFLPLLFLFLLGYLTRFFIVRVYFKPVLLVVGGVLSWFIL